MKLYSAPPAFYVTHNGFVLKCHKSSGRITACEQPEVSGELDVALEVGEVSGVVVSGELDVALEVGEVSGVVGSLCADNERFLLLITHCTPVATYPCSQEKIYHVDRVIAVPLEENAKIDKFQLDGSVTQMGRIKSSQKKLMKFVTDKVSSLRVVDEILALFNDNGDFYVCFGNDLTLTTQRLLSRVGCSDERFFWNRRLLDDLFNEDGGIMKSAHPWITPICQGFVSERRIVIDVRSKWEWSLAERYVTGDDGSSLTFEADYRLTLTLISRRSVKRAGLRYLRRGIDQNADVANFVETELILSIFGHYLSYVQIRGSVPVFWSQRGYRYRPPLVIDKPIAESLPLFEKHINAMLDLYGTPLTIVNLVDQTGRELDLAISYLQHILQMDSPDIAYFSFDFHFHCRALRFHKVNDLISALGELLRQMAFCWVDKSGQMVREQRGIVRTNCVDCLDRTNVVQCAISQAVCLVQAQKLGLVGPLGDSPHQLTRAIQSLWADNGDAISRQYAGTDAMKGDVTRNGQRRIVGMVRDGYTSASRYYLSHMRHAQRQLAIDTLLKDVSRREMPNTEECEADEEESESIARLVHETVHFVLPEREVLVGGWALVHGSHLTDQIDTILLLTRQRVIVAMYDDDSEKLLEVKVIDFEDVIGIQLGTFGKSSRMHLRLYARPNEQFTWRAAKTRLFNNVAITLKSADEADEYIEAIGEQLRVTMGMAGHHLELSVVGKLDGCPERNRRRFVSMLASAFGVNAESSRVISSASQIDAATAGCKTDELIRIDGENDIHARNAACRSNVVVNIEKSDTDSLVIASESRGEDVTLDGVHLTSDGLISTQEDVTPTGTFADQLLTNSSQAAAVCHVRPSKSDGRLVEKASGLVSRLQKLRLPMSRSQLAIDTDAESLPAPISNPFSQFRQQILTSKSRIMLL
ncbi:Phosphatidylinositide phosphatase SAC2 [Toxocara canis]|uniref:Phosphatidylinositide phosphatase SAC2 n=1 Tax=Toxocara canis TaxID=6265 RepID=A0A0B2VC66_TOXCA|nr:Phosphatidylinositide phosphatase SAC2 [Toxocara canis]